MVCGTEGQAVIAAALNETPTKVTTPTWVDHVYVCTYVYKAGTMGIAVKELSTAAETTAYFKLLQRKYGLKQTFQLGQGAFISPQGVVVARQGLQGPRARSDPPPVGVRAAADVAVDNVSIGAADALMGCWTGV